MISRSITRILMLALGWLLLIPGLVIVVLPPPFAFGVFLVLPGVALLIANSKLMRRLIQRIRARNRFVDVSLHAVETRIPGWISRALKSTNPAAHARARRRKRRQKPASV